jgi:CheY-like chemotaxis protein
MPKVLIIDDDLAVQDALKAVVESAGHDVLVAGNGREGIDLMKSDSADLVITDILMPVKEGIETIKELRSTWPSLPVIAISGGGSRGNLNFLDFARSFGASRVIAKPVEPDVLLATIAELVGSKTARA